MTIHETSELGAYIKKRRKALGYTQEYITSVTGLSASFISNVENGKETSELGKVLRLINLLGMDIHIEER